MGVVVVPVHQNNQVGLDLFIFIYFKGEHVFFVVQKSKSEVE